MKIKNVLRDKTRNAIFSVTSETTVLDALKQMAEKNIGAVLVMDEGQLVGIFSERDYARKGILQGRASNQTLIKEVMTSKLITFGISKLTFTIFFYVSILPFYRIAGIQ